VSGHVGGPGGPRATQRGVRPQVLHAGRGQRRGHGVAGPGRIDDRELGAADQPEPLVEPREGRPIAAGDHGPPHAALDERPDRDGDRLEVGVVVARAVDPPVLDEVTGADLEHVDRPALEEAVEVLPVEVGDDPDLGGREVVAQPAVEVVGEQVLGLGAGDDARLGGQGRLEEALVELVGLVAVQGRRA
jgi:hypothetical protein